MEPNRFDIEKNDLAAAICAQNVSTSDEISGHFYKDKDLVARFLP
jgi:hypothetical protein